MVGIKLLAVYLFIREKTGGQVLVFNNEVYWFNIMSCRAQTDNTILQINFFMVIYGVFLLV